MVLLLYVSVKIFYVTFNNARWLPGCFLAAVMVFWLVVRALLSSMWFSGMLLLVWLPWFCYVAAKAF